MSDRKRRKSIGEFMGFLVEAGCERSDEEYGEVKINVMIYYIR